jgi:toxin HigB-1
LQALIFRDPDPLDVIVRPEEMNVLGFNFRVLPGFKPTRYSVHGNEPWRITFEFEDCDACFRGR